MADVSVIIPSYNRVGLIGQTLDSVLAQSEPVREILVVDDGSNDGTPQFVSQYAKAHAAIPIRLIEQANAGPSAARNRGLDEAQGSLIAFLDADDLWLPPKIARQVELLDRCPQAAGVYHRMFKFRQTLDDMQRAEPQNFIDEPGFEHILLTMSIQASTVLIRRQAIDSLGPLRFEPSLRSAEDAIFFAALRWHGPWRMVDEALTAYRIHLGQATSDANHAWDHTIARVNWLAQQTSRLSDEMIRSLQDALWLRLIQGMERRYWQRDLTGLTELRQKVMRQCPNRMRKSFLAQRRIYPAWVYRLIDGLRRS